MKLSKYAEDNGARTGSRPWFEDLPPKVQKECVDGHLKGIPFTVIARWLKAEGYEGATDNKVSKGVKNVLAG